MSVNIFLGQRRRIIFFSAITYKKVTKYVDTRLSHQKVNDRKKRK